MESPEFENTEEAIATLRMATDAACVGVWDRDLNTNRISGSGHFWKILGFVPGPSFDLDGLIALVHAEDRIRVLSSITQACDPVEDCEYHIEYRILWPGGEVRWVSAKGKCLFTQDAEGARKASRFLGTLIDHTRQRLTQQALLQAEQLAATGRLAASIAHEINNPLESITNLLYLLRREDERKQRESYLDLAESELGRVSEIATNTLRFYRDPVEITEVHLPGLFHSVLSLFNGHISTKKIDVRLKLDDVSVTASQGELRQVLLNLVGNALDAMPKGGRLHIRCRRFERSVGSRPPGVGICVADTGSGMAPEVLRRIFEPFYTTKGNSGTGLGLWLSMEILKKHGFRIKVKSKPASGSNFSLYLPETNCS